MKYKGFFYISISMPSSVIGKTLSIVSTITAPKSNSVKIRNYNRCISLTLIGESQCVRALLSKMAGSLMQDRENVQKLRVIAIFCDVKRKGVLIRSLSTAIKAVDNFNIQHGLLALPAKCSDETLQIYKKASFFLRHLFVRPEAVCHTLRFKFHSGKLALHTNCSNAMRGTYWPKRLFDVAGALFLLALAWPAFLLIAPAGAGAY